MSLNKVHLIGHLGRDPEVRYMPNGEAVANFSIATSEAWKDKNGNRQTRTEWHNIVMYRKLAEVAGQYLKKGSQIYLEGRIQSRKYQAKDGTERTAYEIVSDEMKMLDKRENTGQGGTGQGDYNTHPTPPGRDMGQAPMSQKQSDYAAAKSGSFTPPVPTPSGVIPPSAVGDLEDDIPF